MSDYVSKKAELLRFYTSVEAISNAYSVVALVVDFNDSEQINDVYISEEDVFENKHVQNDLQEVWNNFQYPLSKEQQDSLKNDFYELARTDIIGLMAYDAGKDFQPYRDNIALVNEYADAMDQKTKLISNIQKTLQEVVPEDIYKLVDEKRLRETIGEQNLVFDLALEDEDAIAESLADLSVALDEKQEAWDQQYEHFNDGKPLDERFDTFRTNYLEFIRSKYLEQNDYLMLTFGENYEEGLYDNYQQNQEQMQHAIDQMTASIQGLGDYANPFMEQFIEETTFYIHEFDVSDTKHYDLMYGDIRMKETYEFVEEMFKQTNDSKQGKWLGQSFKYGPIADTILDAYENQNEKIKNLKMQSDLTLSEHDVSDALEF